MTSDDEPTRPAATRPVPADYIDSAENANALQQKLILSEIRWMHIMDIQPYALQWAGLISGLIVALAFLGAGVTLVLNGHDAAGGTISVADIAGLSGTFITLGKKASREES